MWRPWGPASLTPGLACHPQFARPPAPTRSRPTPLSSLYSGRPGRVRRLSSLSRCAQSRVAEKPGRRELGCGCTGAAGPGEGGGLTSKSLGRLLGGGDRQEQRSAHPAQRLHSARRMLTVTGHQLT